MSWFQDLAGKAENILNKIDQNAATVLQHGGNPNKDSVPIMVNGPSEVPAVVASVGTFKKSASSISLTSKESSPKPKALSLRPSPSLGDVQKHPMQQKQSSVVLDMTGSTTNMSRSIDGTESGSTPLPDVFTTLSSMTTSRSSDSSAGHLEPDAVSSIEAPAIAMRIPAEETADVYSELNALKIVLIEIKAERDEARNEMRSLQSDLYNLQINSNVSSWQAKCASLQVACEELNERNETFEKSNAKYVKSISDLETKLSKSTHSETELRSQIDWAHREAEQAVNELQQYRLRAQTTLQLKDKLIEQLKSTPDVHSDRNGNANGTATASHALELEHLQREKNDLQKENRSLSEQMTIMREHIANGEAIVLSLRDEHEARIEQITAQLRNSDKKWRDFETDNRTQARELAVVRDEMQRVQADFAGKMHVKDAELAKLRSHQQAGKLSSAVGLQSALSSNDFEGRVQSLTQSLVQKQTSLESVTADRNALRFQLERIEQEYRLVVAQQRQAGGRVGHAINVNDTDDVKARLPGFMQETPFDTRVARRVKRAYSSLDGLGVGVGVFLRRYPLIRICAIFYVVLLHLWVMVVLCTSTPN